MWHVLEHVNNINKRMETLNRILKNDGKLIIAVPNYKSYDAKYYGKFWAAYDVPRHLLHFDRNTIQKLLTKHGFEIETIKPMKFDSFYVSMLSEKYKNSKANLLNAFWIGFKSNFKALNSKEYSSLIYIAKKKKLTIIALTSRQTQANQLIKTIKDINTKSNEPINYVAFIGKRSISFLGISNVEPSALPSSSKEMIQASLCIVP